MNKRQMPRESTLNSTGQNNHLGDFAILPVPEITFTKDCDTSYWASDKLENGKIKENAT